MAKFTALVAQKSNHTVALTIKIDMGCVGTKLLIELKVLTINETSREYGLL